MDHIDLRFRLITIQPLEKYKFADTQTPHRQSYRWQTKTTGRQMTHDRRVTCQQCIIRAKILQYYKHYLHAGNGRGSECGRTSHRRRKTLAGGEQKYIIIRHLEKESKEDRSETVRKTMNGHSFFSLHGKKELFCPGSEENRFTRVVQSREYILSVLHFTHKAWDSWISESTSGNCTTKVGEKAKIATLMKTRLKKSKHSRNISGSFRLGEKTANVSNWMNTAIKLFTWRESSVLNTQNTSPLQKHLLRPAKHRNPSNT